MAHVVHRHLGLRRDAVRLFAGLRVFVDLSGDVERLADQHAGTVGLARLELVGIHELALDFEMVIGEQLCSGQEEGQHEASGQAEKAVQFIKSNLEDNGTLNP